MITINPRHKYQYIYTLPTQTEHLNRIQPSKCSSRRKSDHLFDRVISLYHGIMGKSFLIFGVSYAPPADFGLFYGLKFSRTFLENIIVINQTKYNQMDKVMTFQTKMTLFTGQSEWRSMSSAKYASNLELGSLEYGKKKSQRGLPTTRTPQKPQQQNLYTMKTKLKNQLMRMSYKHKLNQIEALIREGRQLSEKYGYFYVTCAMVVYHPESLIKLSLWIHPSLAIERAVHPIKEGSQEEKEIVFYRSLKTVLRELFPTISLGEAQSYSQLITHIKALMKELNKRLFSVPSDCELKSTFSTNGYDF